MLEIPESKTLETQMRQRVIGKRVASVTMASSPHKFTWYLGDPQTYDGFLSGREIEDVQAQGGNLEITLGNARLLLQDGVNVRLLAPDVKRPEKHQCLMELSDGSALVMTVQMYGGICAYPEGGNDNAYYLVAREKTSPLEEDFDAAHFERLRTQDGADKQSAKAFLATGQRIPGLGNGVLQDILWEARVHPRKKMAEVDDAAYERMFHALKSVLAEMTKLGGRSTEKDLFGNPGGYRCICCKNTLGMPCPACGDLIVKEAYLGGAVYYCPTCQPFEAAAGKRK